MTTRSLHLTSILLAFLATAACGKKQDDAAPSAKPTAAAPPAAEAPKAAEAPAVSGDIDLAPGGDAWKGWQIKAPAETKVSDNGAGGISVNTGKLGFEMTQGDLHISDVKSGAKFGTESAKGTITFTTDTKDELAYTTETPIGDGKVKGYGAAWYVKVDGKRIGCTALLDEEVQLATVKSICGSVHKK
ncbi:MAG: hypothetical protein ABI678_06910 [Kofleriaceae bacterium]